MKPRFGIPQGNPRPRPDGGHRVRLAAIPWAQKRWGLAPHADKSLFPQAAIIPLLDKHHSSRRSPATTSTWWKLIPPLVLSEEDVKWFLTALRT